MNLAERHLVQKEADPRAWSFSIEPDRLRLFTRRRHRELAVQRHPRRIRCGAGSYRHERIGSAYKLDRQLHLGRCRSANLQRAVHSVRHAWRHERGDVRLHAVPPIAPIGGAGAVLAHVRRAAAVDDDAVAEAHPASKAGLESGIGEQVCAVRPCYGFVAGRRFTRRGRRLNSCLTGDIRGVAFARVVADTSVRYVAHGFRRRSLRHVRRRFTRLTRGRVYARVGIEGWQLDVTRAHVTRAHLTRAHVTAR